MGAHDTSRLPADHWMACEYPERDIHDGTARFGPGCRACWIAYDAAIRRGDLNPMVLDRVAADGSTARVADRDHEQTRLWWMSMEPR